MRLHGIGVSAGIAIGAAAMLVRTPSGPTASNGEADQVARFERAVGAARLALGEAQASLAARGSEEGAAILAAQALVLEDPALVETTRRRILEDGLTAEAALAATHAELAALFADLDDAYLRARAADLADVVAQVARALAGVAAPVALDTPAILVAHDLTPSETARLDPARCLALVTETGGPTDHTAIIARSLGLPAVVAVHRLLATVSPGARLIVDGAAGEVVVAPNAAEEAAYTARGQAEAATQAALRSAAAAPATTRDGRAIEVAANIDGSEAMRSAVAHGADAVGLYRTEVLFLHRDAPPSEAEQVAEYTAVLRAAGDRLVIARTLDLGGDKQAPYLGLVAEANPFLGLRGVRLYTHQPALFATQLRALLRASAAGRLALLLPMVSSAAEIEQARAVIEQTRAALRADGYALAESIPLGIMVEVPAAALIVDRLAPLVDFVSVGTNDLVQYTLAADRTNDAVADLAQPFHPAILRLLHDVAASAHAAGRWAGVCGELASQPAAIPLLVGLGYDELSMSPTAIPRAKVIVRDLDASAAGQLAEAALAAPDAAAVTALLAAYGADTRG